MTKATRCLALLFVVGCAESNVPCTSTRTDREDGTTIVTCGASKELVCTSFDCSGIADLTITGTDLTSVNLSALSAGNEIRIDSNGSLTSVRLPLLKSPTDGSCITQVERGPCPSLYLRSNPVLVSIDLPALASGLVVLGDVNALTGLSLPKLASGEVDVAGASALTSVGLPVFSTGNVFVAGTVSLPSISLPAFTMGGVYVRNTSGLTSISAPVLAESHSLLVDDNASLATLSVPSLKSVGVLIIRGNTALPQCKAEAILARLVTFDMADVSGNDTSTTCP